MKATLTKADLQRGISYVQSIVPSRSALPIISNVLILAEKDQLKLVATDLKIGIECGIPAKVAARGSLSVPASRLAEIVRELPEKEVVLEATKENALAVRCDKIYFKIVGLAGEEFPVLPTVVSKVPLAVEQRVLRDLFQKTAFAISTEPARYTLTGLLFEVQRGHVTAVATDGRRLSYAHKEIETPRDYQVAVIIPDKMVSEILRLMKGDGQVQIEVGENQIAFTFDEIKLVSQLIEGNFPDYHVVIPKTHEREVVLDTFDFTMAARRAAAVKTRDYNAAKLHIEKGRMVFSAVTPDVGEAKDEVAVTYEGDEFEIVFNPDFLLDALGSIETDRTVLQFRDASNPGVLKPYQSEDYIHVVMPIKV